MELSQILGSEFAQLIGNFLLQLSFHLLLATISGAIASVAIQQVKKMLDITNRTINLTISVILSAMFGYVVAGVYLKMDTETIILVVIYTVFNAKLIYEAVGLAIKNFKETDKLEIAETDKQKEEM